MARDSEPRAAWVAERRSVALVARRAAVYADSAVDSEKG